MKSIKTISIYLKPLAFLVFLTGLPGVSDAQTASPQLRVIIIRHAEKPIKGFNLSCKGLNRSLQLPAILTAKYGVPSYTYVPAIDAGKTTKHARMFQTVLPLAAKYNLNINSKFNAKNFTGVTADILSKKGTVLIVWESSSIPGLVNAFGVKDTGLIWAENDFDSIWIITFSQGGASLTKDKENLNPPDECPF